MLDDARQIIEYVARRVKARVYGKTFVCPVCHLELSFHDLDADGMVVCPVCGAILHVNEVHGHPLPVVIDMEVLRYQPNLRLHPLATHLPISLMPLAFLGAIVLLFLSIILSPSGDSVASMESLLASLEKGVLFFLYVAVGFSLLTMLSGFIDWRTRYKGRSYRIIFLKLAMGVVFFATGALAVGIQQANLVFHSSGLIEWNAVSLFFCGIYFLSLTLQFVSMATLGHLGGYLAHGK